MKIYKLSIYNGGNTEKVELKAEAHTFDNGLILFWTKNPAQEWAMVAAYPTSVTAITFYDEDTPPKATNKDMIIAAAPKLEEVVDKTKSKRSK